ncbi:hypothetical protein HHI36_018298 [Cryptolaemus montrouzieri]|uniref:Peptidase aspartic putative domain-containing protein n=1 Tax=Cryptolaemus montrouzieri TaxID=559131 RepID=A0ABD2NZY4_9CUCU
MTSTTANEIEHCLMCFNQMNELKDYADGEVEFRKKHRSIISLMAQADENSDPEEAIRKDFQFKSAYVSSVFNQLFPDNNSANCNIRSPKLEIIKFKGDIQTIDHAPFIGTPKPKFLRSRSFKEFEFSCRRMVFLLYYMLSRYLDQETVKRFEIEVYKNSSTHSVYFCDKLRRKTPQERLDFIERLYCLSDRHQINSCKSRDQKTSSLCSVLENLNLSETAPKSVTSFDGPSLTSNNNARINLCGIGLNAFKEVLLATARYWGCGRNQNLSDNNVYHKTGRCSQVVNNNNRCILLQLCPYLPINTLIDRAWPHISDIQLSDPHYFESARTQMICGAEIFSQISKEDRKKGNPGKPVAIETALGWVLMGNFSRSAPKPVQKVESFLAMPTSSELFDLDRSIKRIGNWKIFQTPHVNRQRKNFARISFLKLILKMMMEAMWLSFRFGNLIRKALN